MFLVAWYAASGASLSSQSGTTASVTTASSFTQTDTFTLGTGLSEIGSVRLTDSSGNTYSWDGTQNLPVSDSGTGLVSVTVTLTITYTGNGTYTPSQLSTMWDGVVDSYDTYSLVAHDNTDYTSTTAPTGGNSPKSIKDAAAAVTGKTNQYGLKFATSNSDFDNVGDLSVSTTKGDLKGLTFSNKIATKTYTIFVGVWGIDGFEQKSADSYEAQVVPTLANS